LLTRNFVDMSATIGQDIMLARALLLAGEVVAIPTETVYGLAGNALDARAIAKIYSIKRRPQFNPLIAHFANQEQMAPYIATWDERAIALAEAFWPGPLTLLLPKTDLVPDILTAGSSEVAVRVPSHPLTLALLKQLPFPLAAPSANPSGYISPTSAQHVADQLGEAIPYILDGGPCQVGLESTIIGFPKGIPTLYRLGGLALDAIIKIIGPLQVAVPGGESPAAPGMLSSHYAPNKPFYLAAPEALPYPLARLAALRFSTPHPGIPLAQQIILSKSGDLQEAAVNLFAAMRRLEAMEIDAIVAELAPELGLGLAINDRLRRAAIPA
jgi:L-threonylcarbamoyladenylate synthase